MASRAYHSGARASPRRGIVKKTWDPATSELAICYEADLNGTKSRAVEIVRFGPSGLLVQGEALYGAAL